MEEKKSIKKRKRKRKMWLVLSFASLMCFIILMAEFICGLWLHRNYKAQSIYEKNTYIAYDDPEKKIKYEDYKKIGIDIPIDDLVCIDMSGENEWLYMSYNSEAGILPKDDDLLPTCGNIWKTFFFDTFFDKYSEHMWFYITAHIKVTDATVKNTYIYGSDSLLKKGKMCVNNGECVVSEGYSIGDNIELMDGTERVTGVIKRENIQIPNDYGILGAIYMYWGYDKYQKPSYSILRAYNEFLTLNESEGDASKITFYALDKVIFDRSAISEEDLESLEAVCKVMSLKDAYGRYATAYVYIFVIFPILSLLALIACIKRLKMTFGK